jgi:hypothetical protein
LQRNISQINNREIEKYEDHYRSVIPVLRIWQNAGRSLFLVGVRNRLSVMLGWVWSYFTFDVGVRLITQTGADQSAPIYPAASLTGKSAASGSAYPAAAAPARIR